MGATEHRFVAALAGTPGATWMAATGEEQPDSAAYGIASLGVPLTAAGALFALMQLVSALGRPLAGFVSDRLGDGLRVGGVALGPRGMGLTDERVCSVTLGADVLAPYAFTVDPLRREITFEKSKPKAERLTLKS